MVKLVSVLVILLTVGCLRAEKLDILDNKGLLSSSEVLLKLPNSVLLTKEQEEKSLKNEKVGKGRGGKSSRNEEEEGGGGGEEPEVSVVEWRWEHVGIYISITLFAVLAGLTKVAFHHMHWLSSRVPESCLQLLVGVGVGALLNLGGLLEEPENEEANYYIQFTPELFFLFLLPPIILESAYSLYDPAFFFNLATIILMALVNTLLNFLLIGFLLFGAYEIGAMGEMYDPFALPPGSIMTTLPPELHNITTTVAPEGGEVTLGLMEVLTFASLLSAVDPVAVLAIFQEVGVNPDLYFCLFGESLLNDGVAVVLYNVMNSFAEMDHFDITITGVHIILGITSFFTIAFGGLLIGLLIGFITSFITRFTSEVRVVEPLAVLGLGYLSFIAADLFAWSGIISTIGCGLVQSHYAMKNISKNSKITVMYFIKMLSSTTDSIIFLYLGIAIIEGPHYWHTGFVVWTVVFTLICRFLGVYGLMFIANRYRLHKMNIQEQFIMSYGGLRGAVGFALVRMVSEEVIPKKDMYLTAFLVVVLFTIFIQGATIKPLVNLLHIDKKSEDQKTVSEEVNCNLFEDIIAGIEAISGHYQFFGHWLSRVDDKYLKKWFCNKTNASELEALYEELAISDHLANLYGPKVLMETEPANKQLLLKALKEEEERRGSIEAQEWNMVAKGEPSARAVQRKQSTSIMDALQRGDSQKTSGGASGAPAGLTDRPRQGSIVSGVSDVKSGGGGASRNNSRDERSAFKKAIQNAPFTKLHHKHNPLLINDEDQDLESHLRRRHSAARRISQMVSASAAAAIEQQQQQQQVGGGPAVTGSLEAILRKRQGQRMRSKSVVVMPGSLMLEVLNEQEEALSRSPSKSKLDS